MDERTRGKVEEKKKQTKRVFRRRKWTKEKRAQTEKLSVVEFGLVDKKISPV